MLLGIATGSRHHAGFAFGAGVARSTVVRSNIGIYVVSGCLISDVLADFMFLN